MGHTFRGMVTAWLSLIVLQTVSTKTGSGQLSKLAGDVDHLLQRALSPDVAAIPDRRTAAAATPLHPVAIGADPTVTSPDTPYTRPSDLPVPAPSGGTAGGGGHNRPI